MNLASLDVVREAGDEERVDVVPVTVVRVWLMIEIVRIIRLVSHRRKTGGIHGEIDVNLAGINSEHGGV